MSPLTGRLTFDSDEAYAAVVAHEQQTANGLLGSLTMDAPAGALTRDPDPTPAPLPDSPLGKDYTVDDLKAAIANDPAMAEALALAELQRPQGPRKTALLLLASTALPEAVASLVQSALDILNTPPA